MKGRNHDHELCESVCPVDAEKTIAARERKEEEREAWREEGQSGQSDHLVFRDECGSNSAHTRVSARALKGKRAQGVLPRKRKKNVTVLAYLSFRKRRSN
jgi:hypothetical protein